MSCVECMSGILMYGFKLFDRRKNLVYCVFNHFGNRMVVVPFFLFVNEKTMS